MSLIKHFKDGEYYTFVHRIPSIFKRELLATYEDHRLFYHHFYDCTCSDPEAMDKLIRAINGEPVEGVVINEELNDFRKRLYRWA
jgi:hypothetical protein